MDAQTEQAFKNSGSWFFWIAGCTLINAIMVLTNGDMRLCLGVCLVDVIPAVVKELKLGNETYLVTTLVLAASFVFFYGLLGKFATEGRAWPYLIGLLTFGIDTAVCLAAQDWIGVAIHVFALVNIFSGFRLARRVQSSAAQPVAVPAE